jgi:DNA-binding CsgD family transcriptional regulator
MVFHPQEAGPSPIQEDAVVASMMKLLPAGTTGEVVGAPAAFAREIDRLVGVELATESRQAFDATLEQARCRLETAIGDDTVPVDSLPAACAALCRIDAVQRARVDESHRHDLSNLARIAELTRQFDGLELDDLLDSGATAMCSSMGFHRTLFSVVSRSTWQPRSLFVDPSTPEDTTELRAFLSDAAWRLEAAPLESEVVRRRRPRLVREAQQSHQTFKPLMQVSQSRSYAVAPIWVRRRVIGLLHADRQGDSITMDDLARVEAYAECFGAAAEKALLGRRVQSLARRCGDVLSSAAADIAAFDTLPRTRDAARARDDDRGSDHALGLRTGDAPGDGDPDTLAALSPRETDVLVELARGQTNGQIAACLGVTEGTVKGYVKSVLRKLDVPTRAAAAAHLRRCRGTTQELTWG